MVELKIARPLLEIAKRHPDRRTRTVAVETLIHLPLEPRVLKAAEPVAAQLRIDPGARPRLEVRGVPARKAIAPKPGASYAGLEARLLNKVFDGTRLNVRPGEKRMLGNLTPRKAGAILFAGLHQLAAASEPDTMKIGAAAVALAEALPEPLELDIHQILTAADITEAIPWPQLAWILGRAGGVVLARQFAPKIESASEVELQSILPKMRDIAVNLGAKAPVSLQQGQGKGLGAGRAARISLGHGAGGLAGIGSQAARAAAPAAGATRAIGEPANVRLFPRIDCDAHPVAGSTLSIEVGLSGSADEHVKGGAYLPPGYHRVRVHLLFGEDSQWGECGAGEGASEPASFKVTVPEVDGERALMPVKVNFYLRERWCGEGERNLDVRAGDAVKALDKIPLPKDPAWRDGLVIEPGAQPPDLVVRIQRKTSVGEYLWTCLSPHLKNQPLPALTDASMGLERDAETYVRTIFKPYAGKPLGELDRADIEGNGIAMYEATPKAFKEAYWAVWREAEKGGFPFESIQFITDEPYIPWELMRVYDAARAPKVNGEILAVRHSVGRWLSLESTRLSQKIRVRRMAVSASDYEGVDKVAQKLPWAAKEKEFLESRAADSVPLVSLKLKALLERGGYQLLHFACHGTMFVGTPMNSALITEDPDDLKATVVNREQVREGIGPDQPLVFLNACEVGGTAATLSLVAGFPKAFLYAGAAAVVSPLWAIADAAALEVAKEFYTGILAAPADARPTLGSVMRGIRRKWAGADGKPGNLTYLAYVLYGDPLAKVVYEPERRPS